MAFALAVTVMNRFLFSAAKWLVFLIAALMLYEVLARYSFEAPTSWAPELATLLFGPYFLLGGPYLLHMGGHVCIDLLSARAGPRLALILAVTGLTLTMSFAGILLWFAHPLVVQSYEYAETSYSTWNPVIWPSKAVLPIAAILLIAQTIAEFVLLFSARKIKS